MSITPAENSNELKPEEKTTPQKWWTLVGIGIGVFIFALDVYIVNLALPVMVESLPYEFCHESMDSFKLLAGNRHICNIGIKIR
jgi:hypothetical protein